MDAHDVDPVVIRDDSDEEQAGDDGGDGLPPPPPRGVPRVRGGRGGRGRGHQLVKMPRNGATFHQLMTGMNTLQERQAGEVAQLTDEVARLSLELTIARRTIADNTPRPMRHECVFCQTAPEDVDGLDTTGVAASVCADCMRTCIVEAVNGGEVVIEQGTWRWNVTADSYLLISEMVRFCGLGDHTLATNIVSALEAAIVSREGATARLAQQEDLILDADVMFTKHVESLLRRATMLADASRALEVAASM